tara:strand:+ start:298 stop:558 length:261 start_codon:yes stop_codon:yes gene_type:complete
MAETTYKIDVPIQGEVTWTIKASSLKEAIRKALAQVDYNYDERRDVSWHYNQEELETTLSDGDGVVAVGQDITWRDVRDAYEELAE